ncbi:DUF3097 family protein [Parenemella sanctibonifatiensis]|uniref:DUF3097 domain-containing protein n=1 Tax=Parenemella sanctibonifatiensis TaxID=2016505 RepID=A0A255E157_9ACTN|nr:DUF3097 family protein [Parenemella sanctibonifatiensis]OYN85274.1 hypothetical protein CGZ92_10750 [Parenemella sanctibonifatiensis]
MSPNRPGLRNQPARDRYQGDVLARGADGSNWRTAHMTKSTPTVVEVDMVVEVPADDFVGAVVRWENGLVVLEDRRGKKRSFPLGPGFLLEGVPVALEAPKRRLARPTHSASGSRLGSGPQQAKTALPSRIYVEGRHDAELVEKVWGDDLRHVGVVVEYLEGIDDLPTIITEFDPSPGRRLGVLVDHLVEGSKESRIAAEVARGPWGGLVMVTGHPFIDIWEAIRPQRVGLQEWPRIPRGQDWKTGISEALGRPVREQRDIAETWRLLLSRVTSWKDLDTRLLTEVERLIDFVTE